MRVLHIALTSALLVTGSIGAARADDACVAAADGTMCPDDLDPCTVDQCAGGECRHVDVPNRVTCDPLLDAYRRTLGLGDLVSELTAQLASAPLPATARTLVDDALAGTAIDLARCSDALAGRIDVPAPDPGETIAQARSRAGFGITRATPSRARAVIQVLAIPAVRAAVGPEVVDLARRVRFLYRSTNQLKRELRRLQRVSEAFAH